jgi:hypothetical protein
MRRLLASLAVLSVVSLTGCAGGAASSGANGEAKSSPTAQVNAARAEAEAQEHKLSDLRQEKADLEAQLEGKSAPATSTPAAAPAATPAPAAMSAPAKSASPAPAASGKSSN